MSAILSSIPASGLAEEPSMTAVAEPITSVARAPAVASNSGFFAALTKPWPIILLLAVAWFPLMAYVMTGDLIGSWKNLVLLPAIPAVILLYVLGVRSWSESPTAIIGLTLVFFWLIIAVTAPYLPLFDPKIHMFSIVCSTIHRNSIVL